MVTAARFTVFAALLLTLTACNGGTTEPATVTDAPADGDVVAAAYREYWKVLLAASDPPRPSEPALADHATGDELDNARQVLRSRRDRREVARGRYRPHPVVRTANSDRATVDDCLVADVRIVTATPDGGTRVTRQPRGPFPVTATLQHEDGRWLVASIEAGSFTCSGGRPPASLEDQ